jgi:hypothetical protein
MPIRVEMTAHIRAKKRSHSRRVAPRGQPVNEHIL